jgi:hypothetical protein
MKEFKLDSKLLYSDAEQMLVKVQPQAVLVYTDTRDHRRVVEAATRHRVPVMMEKPLAVSVEDALAIMRAVDEAHIPVLVNYETTWYPRAIPPYITSWAEALSVMSERLSCRMATGGQRRSVFLPSSSHG